MVKKRIKPPADLKFGGMQADLFIIDEISNFDQKSWNTVTIKGRIKLGQEGDQRDRIDTDSSIRGSW